MSLYALVVALVLAGSTALVNPHGSGAPAGAPAIALVNEDHSADFNGETYHFGQEFVSLVSNDTEYNWQVVSRAVAERAYAGRAVSAMIVLPRSFSHDILTLEDLDPTRAAVDYKVVAGDRLSRERLEGQLATILRDFNTRIVKMYFASIAANISDAQTAMSSVVSRHSGLVDILDGSIAPSLGTASSRHGSSVGLARLLTSLNSGWIAAQNGFTDRTTGALTSIADSLGDQRPHLSEYFMLQEQIAHTNVVNGNAAISQQAASNKDHFDRAFTDHIDDLLSGKDAWTGFDGLSSRAPDGTRTGALADLEQAVANYETIVTDYNARVDALTSSLEHQRSHLTESLRRLEALETSLLTQFFALTMPGDNAALGVPSGDPAIDESTYRIDPSALPASGARRALARLIAGGFGDSGASDAVLRQEQKIRDLVATIPTDPVQYDALFAELQGASGFDPAPYRSQLELIRAYAHAHGVASPALTLLQPTGAAVATHAATRSVSVDVPPETRYTVIATLPGGLPAEVAGVSLVTPAPSCPQTIPECVTIDAASASATVDNRGGSEPISVTFQYTIDLTGVEGSATVTYVAQDTTSSDVVGPSQTVGSDTYLLVPADAATQAIGSSDFAGITTYLSGIRTAANLLLLLFGAPSDSLDDFSAAVVPTRDFEGRSTESVYNRYGTVDASTIESRLSEADVADFGELGRDNIAAILAQIDAVREQLEAIDADLDTTAALHLSSTYFSEAVRRLQGWYAAAIASISAAPALWREGANTVLQLTTVPWNGGPEGTAELYVDERTGPALYSALSDLVASTRNGAQSVAASAQLIEDNSAQFDTLVEGVTATQTDTEAVLDAMNQTIMTGTADAAAGGEFSKRFSTVLANTRAAGADQGKIYEAFANPVTATDATPSGTAPGEGGFDARWLLIFGAGSVIGGLISWLLPRRRPRATTQKPRSSTDEIA
ncbi:type VII secretion protein EsaA [Leifsonia shinshuensis]|uniref:type VII secretion protein EsaA n=1 Tax=Leifsonia shinshuensis TaxID=150026 RepID=UPI002857652D|nr:type VII secretion protein EsaA [Leifsonia shinshuensis]MDR6971802.1 type VII secretion EsaA-like protein [Leifsonia shinshuensis]